MFVEFCDELPAEEAAFFAAKNLKAKRASAAKAKNMRIWAKPSPRPSILARAMKPRAVAAPIKRLRPRPPDLAAAAAPAAGAADGRFAVEGAAFGKDGEALGTDIERPKLAPPPRRAADASSVNVTRERPIRRATRNFFIPFPLLRFFFISNMESCNSKS